MTNSARCDECNAELVFSGWLPSGGERYECPLCELKSINADLLVALEELETRDTIMSGLVDTIKCGRCGGMGDATKFPIKHEDDCPYAIITKAKDGATMAILP